nr:DUF1566 domain-containing protein [uncultured Desulfobulbus sp.]
MFKRLPSHLGHHAQRVLFSLCLLFLFTLPATVFSEDLVPLKDKGLVQETQNGLIWQMQRSKKMRSPSDVKAYLAKLNQGQYHDWRLPTKWELYNFFMLFDLKKNGKIELKLEGSYWIRQEDGSIGPASWELGDQCGKERTFYQPKAGYVRALRP